jgi:hypothetical protein
MADAEQPGFTPAYKLLIQYELLPEKQDYFFQYVRGEFVPSLQHMGLLIASVWHVAYGDEPLHQMEFVCENREVARTALNHPRWGRLENRLQSYTRRYRRKLVHYEDRFQF